MGIQAEKISQKNNPSMDSTAARKQNTGKPGVQFADHRPEAVVQRKWQERANHSPQVKQAHRWQAMADNYTARQQHPIQKKSSNTGLPNQLKTGIENLSGYAMDDVKVHYNSGKPAQLQAHAYTQGTDIHVAPGQEKHLPHEAWHVVQQKQGRVKPTVQQMKGKVNVNDDAGLEREADVMGVKATDLVPATRQLDNMTLQPKHTTNSGRETIQLSRSKAGRIAGSYLGPILGAGLAPFLFAHKYAKDAYKGVMGKDNTGARRHWKTASGVRRFGSLLAGLGAGTAGLLAGTLMGSLFTALNAITLGGFGAFAANKAANMTFGERAERQQAGKNLTLINCSAAKFNIDPANINETGTWKIQGHKYTPNKIRGAGQNKVIILFSGTGGRNVDQLAPLADYYAGQGSIVYGADYLGYGDSKHDVNKDKADNSMLSESGLYKDAYRIYQYVLKDAVVTPDKVVLHGYSLGGSVAANLAKRLAKQGARLGGLVLHSSIDTAYTQAHQNLGGLGYLIGPIAGMGTKMAAGDFDTKTALKKLSVYDADLPLHLMSGSKSRGDQLALSETDLGGLASSKFNNVTENKKGAGHHERTIRHAPTANSQHQKDMASLLGRGGRKQGSKAGFLKESLIKPSKN